MSGTLLVEQENRWRRTLPAVLLSAVGAGALTWLAFISLPQGIFSSELALVACMALLAYVLFRVLYPAAVRLMPGGDAVQSIPWTVDDDALTLNGTALPRSAIKMVHVWPNRDALGIRSAGWVVNIETTGKNRVFRSLSEGENADRSAQSLEMLVTALGYGRQWEQARDR